MSSKRHATPSKRLTMRVISRDSAAAIQEIYEQEIPATDHEMGLFLRRLPFRSTVAAAILTGGTVTIERKDPK